MNHHCRFFYSIEYCIHCSFVADSLWIQCRFIYTVEGQHHMCSESWPHALSAALQDCADQDCSGRMPWDLKNSSKEAQPKRPFSPPKQSSQIISVNHRSILTPLRWWSFAWGHLRVKQKGHDEKHEQNVVGKNCSEVTGTSLKVTGDSRCLSFLVANFRMHARKSFYGSHTFGWTKPALHRLATKKLVKSNTCLLSEPKSIYWFGSISFPTLIWLKEQLFYWWLLWRLSNTSMLPGFDRLLMFWVSTILMSTLQTTHFSMLYCHVKEVFVLEKPTFPMYAPWVLPPSNLFICRKKVLFIVFHYWSQTFKLLIITEVLSKRRAEEETGFPHLCSMLKISAFVILSLFSCCFSSKISKEMLILVRSLYPVERNYDFFFE